MKILKLFISNVSDAVKNFWRNLIDVVMFLNMNNFMTLEQNLN